jgi:hypothetical protein
MIGIKSAPFFRKSSRSLFRSRALNRIRDGFALAPPSERFAFFLFSELLCLRNCTRPVPRSPAKQHLRDRIPPLAFVLQSQQNPSRGSLQTKSLHYAVFKVHAASLRRSHGTGTAPSALWAECFYYMPARSSLSSCFYFDFGVFRARGRPFPRPPLGTARLEYHSTFRPVKALFSFFENYF